MSSLPIRTSRTKPAPRLPGAVKAISNGSCLPSSRRCQTKHDRPGAAGVALIRRRVDRPAAVSTSLLLVTTTGHVAGRRALLQGRDAGTSCGVQGPDAGVPSERSRSTDRLRSVQSSSPALTCIIGARRAWIVPMTSSGVDRLQVDARHRHIRTPELALDDRQRHPLPRELDGVRMARSQASRQTIVRRKPAHIPSCHVTSSKRRSEQHRPQTPRT